MNAMTNKFSLTYNVLYIILMSVSLPLAILAYKIIGMRKWDVKTVLEFMVIQAKNLRFYKFVVYAVSLSWISIGETYGWYSRCDFSFWSHFFTDSICSCNDFYHILVHNDSCTCVNHYLQKKKEYLEIKKPEQNVL